MDSTMKGLMGAMPPRIIGLEPPLPFIRSLIFVYLKLTEPACFYVSKT